MNCESLESGWCILRGVLNACQVDLAIGEIQDALETSEARSLESEGKTYGARNLLQVWPGWRRWLELPRVHKFLFSQLGGGAGLVRALYFDKPPGLSWSLPWHRDLTIAVEEHKDALGPFRCPTIKTGVPHVEAPRELLSRMLTLRFHLDTMDDANGPLQVIDGSHADLSSDSGHDAGGSAEQRMRTIHCGAGDVFVMRPLLIHGSRKSAEGCERHRRVVHLEFAPEAELPAGYRWHRFEPLSPA